VGDLAGFFANPARLALAAIMILQALIHAWLVYLTPPQPPQDHRFDLPRLHVMLFEAIFILGAFGDRRNILTWDENLPLRWLGVGIYLIGAVLSVWANFTWVNHLRRDPPRPDDNPVLLDKGLFHSIRYPSLFYLIFFCLGFSIAFRSWIGLALIIPLMAGIFNSANTLDKVFRDRYRHEWARRCYKSKRVIPLVY
jgi:protein-S-isoprenylcysteine O-methyltransferase Ste14